jgi:hypothetical protein
MGGILGAWFTIEKAALDLGAGDRAQPREWVEGLPKIKDNQTFRNKH